MILLLIALAAKHFFVDVWCQMINPCRYKHIYGHDDGVRHAQQHAAGTVLCLVWTTPLTAIGLGLLDGVLHYHIDWAKSNAKKRFGNVLWLAAADQAFHAATYIGIAITVTKVAP